MIKTNDKQLKQLSFEDIKCKRYSALEELMLKAAKEKAEKRKQVGTSITLNEKASKKLNKIVEKNGITPNSAFRTIFNNFYDEKNKSIKVNFEKKKKERHKTYSVRLKGDYIEALDKKAKQLNMKRGELMSLIITELITD